MQQVQTRELDVLVRLIHGQNNAKIAGDLHISPNTINTYRSRIFLSLNCKTIEQAAAQVGRRKLATLPKGARKPLFESHEQGIYNLIKIGRSERQIAKELLKDKGEVANIVQKLMKRAKVKTYLELILVLNY